MGEKFLMECLLDMSVWILNTKSRSQVLLANLILRRPVIRVGSQSLLFLLEQMGFGNSWKSRNKECAGLAGFSG